LLRKFAAYPAMTLLLAACVTINIYFPAAAAEEAARTIVRDVLGNEAAPAPAKPEEQSAPAPKADDKGAMNDSVRQAPLAVVGWLLETLVPAVEAAEADININTPVVSKLRREMAKRQKALNPYYKSGAIGFDNNGLVAVRELAAVPLPQRGRLRRLVADENRDRNALYREIARANGHPQWEPDIRKTFARVWIQEARHGFWYQDAGGKWHQK
jgi:uncharacterized protein YdbL (DUF1318 family)